MTKSNTATAYFAAGCFWHVEEAFRCMKGVTDTKVGYMGGEKDNPSYEDVCTGTTGHAETVKVMYNPEQISYKQLLEKFFSIHDPTTKDQQGPDIGNQYRSAIFYSNETEKDEAISMIEMLNSSKAFTRPIVTDIAPAKTFYEAEEYHQNYLVKHNMRSCYI